MAEKRLNLRKNLPILLLAGLLMLAVALPRLVYESGNPVTFEDGTRRFPSADAYYYLRMARWKLGEDVGIVPAGEAAEGGTGAPAGEAEADRAADSRAADGALYIDTLRYAPEGFSFGREPLLLSGLTALVARIGSRLPGGAGFSVYDAAFFLNLALPPLTVIPLLLLLWLLLADLGLSAHFVPAAVCAGVLACLNGSFLDRTLPGIFDTDLLIPFFFLFQLYSLYRVLTAHRTALSAAALFVVTALFSRWWSGNTFFVIVSAGILLACGLYELLRPRLPAVDPATEAGSAIPRLAATLLLLPAAILASGGTGVLRAAIGRIGIMFRLRSESSFRAGEDWFPNAYTSILEMKQPALSSGGIPGLFQSFVTYGESAGTSGIVNYAGGICVFLAAGAGLLYLLLRFLKAPREKSRAYPLAFFLVWGAASALASLQAVRYQMLLGAPLGLLAGIFTAVVCKRLRAKERLDRVLVLSILFTALLFPTAYGALRTAGGKPMAFPSEDMALAMRSLREDTAEDTVLASWWDFGYYYSDAADRATLFDGGSQSGIRLYWMARAFSTDGTLFPANILRMLAGSGDEATKYLLQKTGDGRESVLLLRDVLRADREGAREYLLGEKGFSEEEADTLLALAHPEKTSPVVLLVSADMIAKSGWFSRFGGWDNTHGTGSRDYSLTADKVFSRALAEGENRFTMSDIADAPVELTVTIEGEGDALTLTADCVFLEGGAGRADAESAPAAGSVPYRFRKIYYDTGERQYLFEPDEGDVPSGGDPAGTAGDSGEVAAEAGNSPDAKLCDLMLVPAGDWLRIVIAGPAISDSIVGELYFRDGRWQDAFVRLDDPETPPFTLPVSMWLLKE